ncbi:MAG TPA: hypothetical protein VMT17_00445 [Anaeromyxobacteraceae bacterium]|nr:hypothetical protein [Anaeromyxobacteraceae bacterium]
MPRIRHPVDVGAQARGAPGRKGPARAGRLEQAFDAAFAAGQALREKQIQQSYRPVIGVHKWFARRPGTLFRALLLSEFAPGPLGEAFYRPHRLSGVIGDPFMGGGTPVFEANRLGFHVVGCDVNPMAHWIVARSLASLDLDRFAAEARSVASDVESAVGPLYRTRCERCGGEADAKYFLWVKTAHCPGCGAPNDLFPGHRLAEAVRHPRHVLACPGCGALSEHAVPPTRAHPAHCDACGHEVHLEGNVSRGEAGCRLCGRSFPLGPRTEAPAHRMWAIEYRCGACYGSLEGRQFKRPAAEDLEAFREAERRLARAPGLPIPEDAIPPGDESDRLRRWGYRRYREMFGARQLLGLGLLLERILAVSDGPVRHALLTVFSDTLRYQNMLCRYDTWALKCQDVFSVHGFPVGLVACENGLLGRPGIGSGSFRHFVEKYLRAKRYCRAPFETRRVGRGKETVPVPGETIEARLVDRPPRGQGEKEAYLVNAPAADVALDPGSLDGVFTDPPYFDNVQYAELMDFCFAWLRLALAREGSPFPRASTRSPEELTGNETLGRGMEHFADGLSRVFRRFASALKPGAPFVFTYHHNDPAAYAPLVVAILDAGLTCTASLPAPAEMSASLHIAGTGSSVLDTVFVCRRRSPGRGPAGPEPAAAARECEAALRADAAAVRKGGVRLRPGDLRCLLAGHVARAAVRSLHASWAAEAPVAGRLRTVQGRLEEIACHLASSRTRLAGRRARGGFRAGAAPGR